MVIVDLSSCRTRARWESRKGKEGTRVSLKNVRVWFAVLSTDTAIYTRSVGGVFPALLTLEGVSETNLTNLLAWIPRATFTIDGQGQKFRAIKLNDSSRIFFGGWGIRLRVNFNQITG